MYIDEIETAILERQKQLEEELKKMIMECVMVLCLFLLFSFFVVWSLSTKIKKNLMVFSQFFTQSAAQALPIDMDRVTFSEFRFLAESANQMSRERREVDRSLRESETRYRTLFEASFDALAVIDVRSRTYIECNQATLKLYGLESEKDFIGREPGEFSPEFQPSGERSRDLADKLIATAISDGQSIFEWTSIRDQKEIFPTLITLSSISIGNKDYVLEVVRDLTELKASQDKREQLIKELKQALSDVTVLSGLLPICSSCKKVRDDQGYWNQIESYVAEHSQAKFSHGMCPECSDKLYGDQPWYIRMKKKKGYD